MSYRNRDVKPSRVVHVAIQCGACNVISNCTGEMDIEAGSCVCHPDSWTCMCFTGKRLNFICPREECRYSDSIEF